MKTMTCKPLPLLSKQHGMEMFQAQDSDHLKAMEAMQGLMQKPGAMQSWIEEKRKLFNSLAED
jgi:hypothetical protein